MMKTIKEEVEAFHEGYDNPNYMEVEDFAARIRAATLASVGIELENNQWTPLPEVTRVDINDRTGKIHEDWHKANEVKLMLQDNKKTLVIFIENKEKGE